MKSISVVIKELGDYIIELESKEKEYKKLSTDLEEKGLHKLDFEETENYGVYTGKAEILSEMKTKLLTIIKE